MKNKVPKYCYHRKGRWVFIPYVNGKLGKEISLKHDGKLIRLNDPMSRIWTAWEKLTDNTSDTLTWLINKYLKSGRFNELMPRTKRSYKASAGYLKFKQLKNNTLFGDVSFEAITPGVITKLSDSMNDSPTAAKHRIQFLAAVYTWAHARDICSSNPCRAAQRPSNTNKKAKEYVEDKAFFFALDVAKELQSYIYPMMILAYCCRARVGELSRSERIEGCYIPSGIKISDINDEGIHIRRSKGSLPEITLWSDFLKEGYKSAIKYSKTQDDKCNIVRLMPDPYLIRNQAGDPIKKNAFDCSWQRLMKKCIGLDNKFKRFTIHELKAKGIDDHKNQSSGHKTESAKAVYLRKIKRTESTK